MGTRAHALIDELEKIAERGRKVKVPKLKTTKEMVTFYNSLGLDDTVVDDLFDPETGEVILEPGETKRKLLKHKAKTSYQARVDGEPFDYVAPAYSANWSESDFHAFYYLVTKELSKMVDDPETLLAGDYDVYTNFPAAIKRKDNKPFTDVDIWNIQQYKAYLYAKVLPHNIEVRNEFGVGAKKGTFSPIFK